MLKENYQQSILFNTTNLSGPALAKAEDKILKQDDVILKFFEANQHWFTPYQVWLKLFSNTAPITSVRRSMTTLTESGKLIKSETADGVGQYGDRCHTWKFRTSVL